MTTDMLTCWQRTRIGDTGRVVTGKTPPTKQADNFGPDYPFITIPDLDGRVWIENTQRSLSEQGAQAISSSLLPSNAVMMSCIATVGRCGITTKKSFTNQQINSVIPGKGVVPQYLYYTFTQLGRELEAAGGGGSVYTNVSKSRFSDINVVLPPFDEQRAIAGVLGALDDKIEQNRRTAQTLEQLARAIFRAWFVDFEPVKAKAAGATDFPSMPQPVFDTLPTRFVDSAIGPVPEGWEVKAIDDVVTVRGGGTPSTKNPEYWDGGLHCWATPKDMSRLAHPVLLGTERHITDSGVYSISSGILPMGTVLMSSRAPVGYLAISGVPTAINQGFIAMVCDGPLPPTYVLNWAFTSMDVIKAHASGTTFPEISKKNFRPLPVVLPTDDVISAYQQLTYPLFELLTACVEENERLAQLRDYLLPKLLSGQVRVGMTHD